MSTAAAAGAESGAQASRSTRSRTRTSTRTGTGRSAARISTSRRVRDAVWTRDARVRSRRRHVGQGVRRAPEHDVVGLRKPRGRRHEDADADGRRRSTTSRCCRSACARLTTTSARPSKVLARSRLLVAQRDVGAQSPDCCSRVARVADERHRQRAAQRRRPSRLSRRARSARGRRRRPPCAKTGGCDRRTSNLPPSARSTGCRPCARRDGLRSPRDASPLITAGVLLNRWRVRAHPRNLDPLPPFLN